MKILRKTLAIVALLALLLFPAPTLDGSAVLNVPVQKEYSPCEKADVILRNILKEQKRLLSLTNDDNLMSTITYFEYQGLEVLKDLISNFKLGNCIEV